MLRNVLVLGSVSILIAGCDPAAAVNTGKVVVVDTHIDVPYRLNLDYENVGVPTENGDFDYERARQGGLSAAFMSIYVPVEKQEPGVARDFADHLIDLVESTVSRNKDKFLIARSTRDVYQSVGDERVGFALGIENGAAIGDNLANVWHFYRRGVRYITLAHAKANLIADSSYDTERPWGGLSEFGSQVVREMNLVGIIVDVSHITDEAILDVLEVSRAPVIASHSSARSFTPGFERNLSDDLIRKIAAAGGVIQINFGSVFLTREANAWYGRYVEAANAYREANGIGPYESIADFEAAYRAAEPLPFATLDDVLDHIDHVVGLVGVDHVGFGSDFDGVGDSLPVGLKSVADYPALIQGLYERGYSEADVRKIAGLNTLRVWTAVENSARFARALHESRLQVSRASYHK